MTFKYIYSIINYNHYTAPLLYSYTIWIIKPLQGHQSRDRERTRDRFVEKLHIPFAHLPLE